jgi:hypothetical protein
MRGASQLLERLGGGNDSAPAAIRDRPIFGTDVKGAGGDELEAMRPPEDARLKPAAFLIAPRTRRAGTADGPARRGFMRRPETEAPKGRDQISSRMICLIGSRRARLVRH